MKRSLLIRLLMFGGLLVAVGFDVAAKEPMFKRWMVPEDPGDAAILDYWDRAERDELGAPALVDLGTMLFYRGFPADAVKVFKRALDADSEMAEAWFRIGLVRWREGKVRDARQAYQRCLKIRPGHGWGNFYLALLEEKDNNPSVAIEHYRTAFRHAPELSDPSFNPEVLYSKLQLAALIPVVRERMITSAAPFAWLEPAEVDAARRRVQPAPPPSPTPVAPAPAAAAAATPAVGGAAGGAATGPAAETRGGSQRLRPVRGTGEQQPGTPTTEVPPGPPGSSAPTGAGGTSYLHIPDASPEASLRTPGASRGLAA
jgi:hypothetical protein